MQLSVAGTFDPESKPTLMLHLRLLLGYFFIVVLVNTNFAQDYSKQSQQHSALWPYDTPERQNGPTRVTLDLLYRFQKDQIGTKPFVSMKYSYRSVVMTVDKNGRGMGFRYNGKTYYQPEMHELDGLGAQGWDEIVITALDVKIDPIGVAAPNTISMGRSVGFASNIGDMPSDGLLGVNLNFVHSYCTFFNYTGSEKLVSRIKALERLTSNRTKYQQYLKDADEAFRRKEWQNAKNLYNDALGLFPNETYPQQRIDEIDNLLRKPTSASAGLANAVVDNSGPNSSQTTRPVINTNPSGCVQPTPVGNSNAWSAEQVQAFLDEDAAARQGQYDKITQESEKMMRTFDQTMNNYQVQQNIAEKREQAWNNANMDQSYSSDSEIEADYQRKLAELEQSFNEIGEANSEYYLNNLEYNSGSGDANVELANLAINGTGALLSQRSAERQKEEAQAELTRQKNELLVQKQRALSAERSSHRRSIPTSFPAGKIPTSSDKTTSDRLYYFFYAYSSLANDYDAINISNVFEIAKYSDGTWPLQSKIMDEIKLLAPAGTMVVLVGQYPDGQSAEYARSGLLSSARKGVMAITEVEYLGKPQKVAPKTGGTATTKQEDFWGTPVKTQSTPKPKPTTNSPKTNTPKKSEDDFWGTSIKK